MKKKVAFLCVHNSCRSQIAEAWAKELGRDVMDSYSAGTENHPEIKPKAVQVMEEVGIDMKSQYPKLLSDVPENIDILISMGCNVVCPYIPNSHTEDWGIEDPSGCSIEDFRETREIIRIKIEDLIYRIKKNQI